MRSLNVLLPPTTASTDLGSIAIEQLGLRICCDSLANQPSTYRQELVAVGPYPWTCRINDLDDILYVYDLDVRALEFHVPSDNLHTHDLRVPVFSHIIISELGVARVYQAEWQSYIQAQTNSRNSQRMAGQTYVIWLAFASHALLIARVVFRAGIYIRALCHPS